MPKAKPKPNPRSLPEGERRANLSITMHPSTWGLIDRWIDHAPGVVKPSRGAAIEYLVRQALGEPLKAE